MFVFIVAQGAAHAKPASSVFLNALTVWLTVGSIFGHVIVFPHSSYRNMLHISSRSGQQWQFEDGPHCVTKTGRHHWSQSCVKNEMSLVFVFAGGRSVWSALFWNCVYFQLMNISYYFYSVHNCRASNHKKWLTVWYNVSLVEQMVMTCFIYGERDNKNKINVPLLVYFVMLYYSSFDVKENLMFKLDAMFYWYNF